MAHQDVRYYLNGLLLELEDKVLRAVATDGHRLAKTELELDTAVTATRQVIVPRKAILELGRLLNEDSEPVTVELNPKHMRVNIGATVCITKLIDGKFPEYQSVVSPLLTHTLTVNRGQLLDSLSRAAILTNEKHRGVRLSINPERLSITANTPDQEEASDEFPISFEGDPLEIGFNVSYVMEALRVITAPEVEIRLRDTNSSCIITAPGDETMYLIMPMRL
jgi:DNA polymerase-3 subunit beta